MPGIANYQIPPLAKWEDFEDLCFDLWRKIWADDQAQKHGRRGQPQHGVDIYGRPGCRTAWAGVQCKGKSEMLGTALTRKELLAEVEKAKGFMPALSEFTIVSTGPRDAELQKVARTLTEEHLRTGLFSVHVWAWEDLLLRLNEYPDVAAIHFPHFHSVQSIKRAPFAHSTNPPAPESP